MKLTTAAAIFLSVSNTSAISIDESECYNLCVAAFSKLGDVEKCKANLCHNTEVKKANLRGIEKYPDHEAVDVGILHGELSLSSDSKESDLSCEDFCRLTNYGSGYDACVSSLCGSEATTTKFVASKEKRFDLEKCYDECRYRTTTYVDYVDCINDICFGSAEDADVGMLHADESAELVSASTEEKGDISCYDMCQGSTNFFRCIQLCYSSSENETVHASLGNELVATANSASTEVKAGIRCDDICQRSFDFFRCLQLCYG